VLLKLLDMLLSLLQQPPLLSELDMPLLSLLDMPPSLLDMLLLDMPPSLDDIPLLDMPPPSPLLELLLPPSPPPSWAPAGAAEKPSSATPPRTSAAAKVPCLARRRLDGGSESASSMAGGELSSLSTVVMVVWSAHPAASTDALVVTGQLVAGRLGARAAGALGAAAGPGFGFRLRQSRTRSLDLIVRTSLTRSSLVAWSRGRTTPRPTLPDGDREGNRPGVNALLRAPHVRNAEDLTCG
jgi:hypothetical protein